LGTVAAMSFNWKSIRCNTSRSAEGREGDLRGAMFFTAEVYVAALVQEEQRQARDHDKSEYKFPHLSFLQKQKNKKAKKNPKKSPRHMDDEGLQIPPGFSA
jgi:hypothetical protein